MLKCVEKLQKIHYDCYIAEGEIYTSEYVHTVFWKSQCGDTANRETWRTWGPSILDAHIYT